MVPVLQFRIFRLSETGGVQVSRSFLPEPNMRFLLSEDHWAIDFLFPGEWDCLRSLPRIASGRDFSESARARLFPSPLAPEVLADESTLTQIEDWEELIRPELADTFAKARSLVERDLSMSEVLSPEDLDDDSLRADFEAAGLPAHLPEMHRVTVPYEHTEAWYSTLNQARLLMNEEYDLAASEDRHLAKTQGPNAINQDRLLLIAQYELYSVLQSILVENVMAD